MTETRRFAAPTRTVLPFEVEVTLTDQIADGQAAVEIEPFTALPGVPSATVAAFFEAQGDPGRTFDAVTGFLSQCIVKDQRGRWDALVADTDRLVDIRQLQQIVTWLLEEYEVTGDDRPTLPPGSSTRGRRGTGRGSTAARSSRAQDR